MAKFYTFRQNNSGGRFKQNNEVDIKVVIEANNAEHANKRAEEIGIYFDGCSKGIDCPCCGDRWYEVYEIDGRRFRMSIFVF